MKELILYVLLSIWKGTEAHEAACLCVLST